MSLTSDGTRRGALRRLEASVQARDDGAARAALHDVLEFAYPSHREGLDVQRLCRVEDDSTRLRLKSRPLRRGERRDTRGGSRFGGAPLLPKRGKWPRGASGPLDFVGQLDFAELARVHRGRLPLPKQGVLGLFYDLEYPLEGLDSDWTCKANAWRLVFLAHPNEECGEGTVEASESLPVRILEPKLEFSGVDSEVCQVGGRPAWIQGDPRLVLTLRSKGVDLEIESLRRAEKRGLDVVRLARSAKDWRLLWQIPSDDVFDWGDCGSLYILVRARDLRQGRFDEARCVLQSH